RDEAGEKRKQRRLAATARGQQRHPLARRDREVEIVEDWFATPRVAEAQLPDADRWRLSGHEGRGRVLVLRSGQLTSLPRQAHERLERRLAGRPVVPDGGK